MTLDELSPEERGIIAGLESEIAQLTQEMQGQEDLAKKLMREEDFAAGKFFAAEIFAAKQEKLRLEVEIQLRKNRKNRIILGIADGPAPGILM